MEKPDIIFRWRHLKSGHPGFTTCRFTHKDGRCIDVMVSDRGYYVVTIYDIDNVHKKEYHDFPYIEDVRDFLVGIVKEKKR